MPADGASFPDFSTIPIELPPLLSLADFMATYKTPDYIVDGIVQRGRLYALTSPTGHGKTAVAQYIGCCSRRDATSATSKSPKARLSSWQARTQTTSAAECTPLVKSRHRSHQSAHARDAWQFPTVRRCGAGTQGQDRLASGINPVLIIVDTAASFFPGDDDNANVPMGAYARNLRLLTTCEGRPAVLVPTHPIKNPDKDNLLPRGGGAFLNELDGNLSLWADTMGESAALHWQGKLRGADFQPVSFALQQVKIISLLDQRGRPIVSIVATLQTTAQAEDAARQAHSDEDTVLELLRRHPGISLRDIGLNAGWVTPAGSAAVSKVHRLMKTLQRDKLVKLHRGKWCLTAAGEREKEAK